MRVDLRPSFWGEMRGSESGRRAWDGGLRLPNGDPAATDVEIRFTSIDVVGTAASVRLDADDWGGHRFTDFFNLVKIDGTWTIVSEVFHLHG